MLPQLLTDLLQKLGLTYRDHIVDPETLNFTVYTNKGIYFFNESVGLLPTGEGHRYEELTETLEELLK